MHQPGIALKPIPPPHPLGLARGQDHHLPRRNQRELATLDLRQHRQPFPFSFPPLLEFLLNRLRDLRNEKASVRTICKRDEAFSTCPPTRLIRDGSAPLARDVKPPCH